jgi:Flp pilus assembly protein TadD
LTQIEFDIEFFYRILQRNGDDVDVLRRLVEIHARRGEHAEALILDRQLVRVRPRDAIAHYNLACSLSVLGHVEQAIAALDLAIELGYADVIHMEHDPDLEPVRGEPGFRQLLLKHGIAR